MTSKNDCGCEQSLLDQAPSGRTISTSGVQSDVQSELLAALGAEIAQMPEHDMFDLPVGDVKQAFQRFYHAMNKTVVSQEDFRGGTSRRRFTPKLATMCPSAKGYLSPEGELPPPDTRTYIDYSWARELSYRKLLDSISPSELGEWEADVRNLTDIAERNGLKNAARNLRHWLGKSGEPIKDYNVEQMLTDLPLWKKDVDKQLEIAIKSLVQKKPHAEDENCAIFMTYTQMGTTKEGKPTWRRVGLGDRVMQDIYSGSPFEFMDLARSLLGEVPEGTTQAEYDWYLAMNAFDYTHELVMVWNKNSGHVEVCYVVHIADEYAWYPRAPGTGVVDIYMAQLEYGGRAKWFEIKGRSSNYCFSFIYPYEQRGILNLKDFRPIYNSTSPVE